MILYPQAILKFHHPSNLDYKAHHGLPVNLLFLRLCSILYSIEWLESHHEQMTTIAEQKLREKKEKEEAILTVSCYDF